MALPMVAIVGRPNVGKSSLLNMMAGRRISIVDPTAGVTRDRVSTLIEHKGAWFELVDTGGYGIVDRDDLGGQVEQQIMYAVREAAAILFVVDGREGVVTLDEAVASWLRKHQRPVLLLANKVDAPTTMTDMGGFHALGFGEPVSVSAMHGRGEEEIKDWIVQHIGPATGDLRPADPVMKIAIVGRRNVGKSTFTNALAGEERVIVSEVAGTTRDAVDVRIERDGHVYLIIDTAGVRKRRQIQKDDIEFYSFHRAQMSVRRADVVLFMIDSTEQVGRVDKQLAAYIAENHKPCIIVVNKWDLAKDRADTEQYGDYLSKVLPGLEYAPIAFTTAKVGRNVQGVIDLSASLFKQSRTRVSTGQLNSVISAIGESMPTPAKGAGRVKLLYGTQVSTEPPTIVLFVNDPERVTPSIRRFILNRLRESLPFAEVPIRLIFRSRHGTPAEESDTAHRR